MSKVKNRAATQKNPVINGFKVAMSWMYGCIRKLEGYISINYWYTYIYMIIYVCINGQTHIYYNMDIKYAESCSTTHSYSGMRTNTIENP